MLFKFINEHIWKNIKLLCRYVLRQCLIILFEININLDFIAIFSCNHFIFRCAGLFQVRHITEKRMIRIFLCSEIWSEPLRQSSKCIKSNKWTYSVQLKRSIYQFDAGKLCLWFYLTLSNPFFYPFSFSFTLILSAMDHWANKVITHV